MNEEFACAILFEHVRAFQMQKSSQSMDCFSLAIQVYNTLLYNIFCHKYAWTYTYMFFSMEYDFRKF